MTERAEQLAASGLSTAGLIAIFVSGGVPVATVLLVAASAFSVLLLAQQHGRADAPVRRHRWISAPVIAILAALLLAASTGSALVPALTEYPLPGALAVLGCGMALAFGGYRDGVLPEAGSAHWSLLATAAAITAGQYPYASFARTADGILAVLAVLLMFARAIPVRVPPVHSVH